ncbi:MAG: Hsp20/alpha crystallin family protein [Kiritimatiellae bacterium]|nr:Hsp20/alpha crystallin family protein [Kiritimatiellia bacterium]
MAKSNFLTRFSRGERDVPVRRAQWNPYRDFQSEMNRLFDDFFTDFSIEPRWGGFESEEAVFAPGVNLSESDKEITVAVELPGMDEKDVKVEMDDNVITISGEKKVEKEEKKRNWHFRESSYGSFRRSIPLPASVSGDDAKASFKRGVLTVTVPKREEDQANRKTVKIETD